MRTLLVLLPVVFGSDDGVRDSVGRPAAYAEARQSFVRAFQSGALDEARTALARRRAAAPGRVDVGHDLACVEARSGQLERAFGALGPVAGAGLDVDPAADTDLAPALAADGKTILVPDWTLGLLALPLAGGTPEPVRGPDDLVTGGIDGLLAAEGGVLAVQNGIVVPRLVRPWVGPSGGRITRWTVLAQGPELADPTHVVVGRAGALAIADSGWARFTGEGGVRPNAPAPRLRILRLDLH
jgi:hypothetical protein